MALRTEKYEDWCNEVHALTTTLPGDGTADTIRNLVIHHGYDGSNFAHMTCAEVSYLLNSLVRQLPAYIVRPVDMLVYNTTAPSMVAVKLNDIATSLSQNTQTWREERKNWAHELVPAIREERLLLIKRLINKATRAFDAHYRLTGRNPEWLDVLKAEIHCQAKNFTKIMTAYLRMDEQRPSLVESHKHAERMAEITGGISRALEKMSRGFMSEAWMAHSVLGEIQARLTTDPAPRLEPGYEQLRQQPQSARLVASHGNRQRRFSVVGCLTGLIPPLFQEAAVGISGLRSPRTSPSTKHQPPATKGQMREPRHNGAPLSALALAPGAPTASQLLGRKHALHQSEGRERRLGNPVSPSGLKPAVAHRFGKAFSSDNAADGPRFDPSDIFAPRIEGSPLPPTWASMSQPDRKQWCASKGIRYSTDRYRTAQGTATRPFWIDIAIPAEVAAVIDEHWEGASAYTFNRRVVRGFETFPEAQSLAKTLCKNLGIMHKHFNPEEESDKCTLIVKGLIKQVRRLTAQSTKLRTKSIKLHTKSSAVERETSSFGGWGCIAQLNLKFLCRARAARTGREHRGRRARCAGPHSRRRT